MPAKRLTFWPLIDPDQNPVVLRAFRADELATSWINVLYSVYVLLLPDR